MSNYLQFIKVVLDPMWNAVFQFGSVALGLLDRIQSEACGLINSQITNQQPKLQLRTDVASLSLFYRNFFGHCLDELRSIILPSSSSCSSLKEYGVGS